MSSRFGGSGQTEKKSPYRKRLSKISSTNRLNVMQVIRDHGMDIEAIPSHAWDAYPFLFNVIPHNPDGMASNDISVSLTASLSPVSIIV